jgi:hypothetical protein
MKRGSANFEVELEDQDAAG